MTVERMKFRKCLTGRDKDTHKEAKDTPGEGSDRTTAVRMTAAAALTALVITMMEPGASVLAWESVGGSSGETVSESGTSATENMAAVSEAEESGTAAEETSETADSGTDASGTSVSEGDAAYASRIGQEKAYMLQALDQLQEWGLSPIAIWARITGDESILEVVENAAGTIASDVDSLSAALSDAGTDAIGEITESVTETVTEAVEEQTEKARQSLIERIREMVNEFIDGL